ncbi:GFA family protein [Rhizobiaceae sp. 2RAB30]
MQRNKEVAIAEPWDGGCLCGHCRYSVQSSPSHVGYCHCDMCKRATGGPFAVLIRVEKADVGWTNPPASYRSSPLEQ